MNEPIDRATDAYLEERISHLEAVERFVIDSLELAASLGDFQNSINKLHELTTILEETGMKVRGLIPFETVAFFLVDEANSEFTLRYIDSEDRRAFIQSEVDHAIDSGVFAWALREKRPVVIPTQGQRKSLILHSMATSSRIRGMFVGLLSNDAHSILNVSLSLVSFVLFNSANALESFELYRKIREINSNLARIDNYQLLFEAAPDGVEVVDAAGNIIHSNEAQKKLLGYDQEQLTGSLSADHFSEKGREALAGHLSALQENGYWEGEVELVTTAGDPVPVWRKEKAIYDKERRFIGAVAFNRDITKRKRAEEAIVVAKNDWESTFDSVTDIITIHDADFNIVRANPAARTVFGLHPQEAVPSHKCYRAYHGGDVPPEECPSRLCLQSGRPCTVELFEPHLNKHLEIRVMPRFGSDEKPIGLIHIVRDITERKQAEEEKRGLMERLQRSEKMEALGQLAGGVAHDLNNVLGVMSGYSELMMEEMPEGHRTRVHVEKIFQSAGKGAAIIQDLLTLARRGVTAKEVVNLNSVVSDFLKSPVFEKMKDYHPRVSFRTACDMNLLNIKGSPVHLEKTLMNLVSNAAESIAGEGEVTIRTESRYLDEPIKGYDDVQDGDYAVLTVSDTGMGIPPKDREKIFEPFYTKKKMGRSGTGLGLAIVWGAVKDHNGYIDVQTEIGEGTTFTLYFPVTREEAAAPMQKEPIERYLGKGESVLVIDDVAEQRDIASRLLSRLGYRVHSVSGGEEAVAYLKQNSADILVLDMIMEPGLDGLETYQRVLAIHPKQKAIIVSGFSETERVREAQRLGAGAYVRKPYVMEKIGLAIRDELHRV